VRYLWISSFTILVAGIAVLAGGLIGLLEPIAVVLGLLLFWTGIVKIVVLRIWRRSIDSTNPTLVTAKAETMSQVSRFSG
jgi:hypothetical protein